MLRTLCHSFPAWMVALSFLIATPVRSAPPNVIFDSDMWSDIDDPFALAMLHALHDRREINLIAVTLVTDEKWCAPYVDLVNTFYGHPQIPIGGVRNGLTAAEWHKRHPGSAWPDSGYVRQIVQRTDRHGAPRYPRRLTEKTPAPAAVAVLRQALAAQPDASVVMIQVGFSTNFAHLLASPPDAVSRLPGRDLIRQKVRLLSLMGGNFVNGASEFNLKADLPSAQQLFAHWPTPIVVSGAEIGLAMRFPSESIARDFAYTEHHPLADSYRTLFCGEQAAQAPATPLCPAARSLATFDLTSVLYAARPDRDYFSLSKPGTITVLAGGATRFVESPDGLHRYLILSEAQKARALEAMVMLTTQPPRQLN